MIDGTYKITFNGYKIGEAGQVVSWSDPNAFHTITLLTDGHGSIQSTSLTGRPGDVVTLSTEYSSYYRFDNYGLTGGGSLDGNTYTFGYEDATIQANFKTNSFTATGSFEKGSNTTIAPAGYRVTEYSTKDQYGIMNSFTGDIPSEWYSESNRWNPSNASSYNIAYTGKMSWTGNNGYTGSNLQLTAYMIVGSTNYDTYTSTQNANTKITFNYSKTRTVSDQGYIRVYGRGGVYRSHKTYASNLTYVANATSGTWSATGIAP